MENRKILREISRMFSVSIMDLPRTIERFKKEVEDMETKLRSRKS
jgi:hypothetical protein